MPDREKVIKGLENIHAVALDKEQLYVNHMSMKDFNELLADALELLKEQKAEAKWIYGEDKTGVDGWHCSECNFFEPWFYEFTDDIDFIRFYGHCPKCGRRMTSYTGKPTQEGWQNE